MQIQRSKPREEGRLVEIRVDGKSYQCEPSEFLIDVARRNDIDIPTLCHHEGLRGQGCCRVCIVEMDGKIVPACVTRLEKECEVSTNNTKVTQERGIIFALLMKQAPSSPEIALMAERYGNYSSQRLNVVKGSDRCVLCGLCVRACQSLGNSAITSVLRGTSKKITTPYDESSTDCIGCGSCAEVCPTKNITVIDKNDSRIIWEREFRILRCRQCGASLGTAESVAYAKHNKRVALRMGDLCEDCRRLNITARINEMCI
jgi:NADH dehydrogenase/NADH:ubiquinone oxidoreductase subunit G